MYNVGVSRRMRSILRRVVAHCIESHTGREEVYGRGVWNEVFVFGSNAVQDDIHPDLLLTRVDRVPYCRLQGGLHPMWDPIHLAMRSVRVVRVPYLCLRIGLCPV